VACLLLEWDGKTGGIDGQHVVAAIEDIGLEIPVFLLAAGDHLAAMTRDIWHTVDGGRPRPDRRSRFVRSKNAEAMRSSRPMSALATASGDGLPVTSHRTSPAMGVTPPKTAQPPPTTLVVDAGSVLRRR